MATPGTPASASPIGPNQSGISQAKAMVSKATNYNTADPADMLKAAQALKELTADMNKFTKSLSTNEVDNLTHSIAQLGKDLIESADKSDQVSAALVDVRRSLNMTEEQFKSFATTGTGYISQYLKASNLLSMEYDKLGLATEYEMTVLAANIELIDEQSNNFIGLNKTMLLSAKSSLAFKKALDANLKTKKGDSKGIVGHAISSKQNEAAEKIYGSMMKFGGPKMANMAASLAPILAKFSVWGMIASVVVGTILEGLAKASRAQMSLYKATGNMSLAQKEGVTMMLKYNAATIASGMSLDDSRKRLDKASSSYMQLTRTINMGSDVMWGHMTNNIVKMSASATAFGADAETYIGDATLAGRQFGVGIDKLSDSYLQSITTMQDVGLQYNETTAYLKEQGDALEYTNVGMKDSIGFAEKFTLSLRKFAVSTKDNRLLSIIPQMLAKTMQAFTGISPVEHMAYLNKPVTNVGESWMEAVNAKPEEKMAAFMKRMYPEVSKYGGKEAEGRLGIMMEGLLKLPPTLAARLSPIMMKISKSGGLEKFGKATDEERQGMMLAAATTDAQRKDIQNMGTTIQRFNDPMQYLINILEGFKDAVGLALGGILKTIGQGALVAKMESSLNKGQENLSDGGVNNNIKNTLITQ